MQTQKVLEELANNETLLYITQLENEIDVLRKQVQRSAGQVLQLKVRVHVRMEYRRLDR